MSEPRVVLNRSGLIQLSVGMVALLGLGFVAGTVVGYGVHVDPVLRTGVAGIPIAAGGQGNLSCLPAESARMAEAPAATTSDAPRAASAEPVEPPPSGRAAETAAALSEALDRPVGTRSAQVLPTQRDDGTLDVEAAPVGRFAVQLGVFGVESNADRFANGLRGRGYDPLIVAARNRSGQWMKRVHLSVFDTEASALAAAETFSTREGLPAVVVMYEEEGTR